MIYFFQRTDKNVKIGTTIDYLGRKKDLTRKYGNLNLLGWLPGSYEEESRLHVKFSHCRTTQGEWFYPSTELLSFIDSDTHKTDPIGREEVDTLQTLVMAQEAEIARCEEQMNDLEDEKQKLENHIQYLNQRLENAENHKDICIEAYARGFLKGCKPAPETFYRLPFTAHEWIFLIEGFAYGTLVVAGFMLLVVYLATG